MVGPSRRRRCPGQASTRTGRAIARLPSRTPRFHETPARLTSRVASPAPCPFQNRTSRTDFDPRRRSATPGTGVRKHGQKGRSPSEGVESSTASNSTTLSSGSLKRDVCGGEDFEKFEKGGGEGLRADHCHRSRHRRPACRGCGRLSHPFIFPSLWLPPHSQCSALGHSRLQFVSNPHLPSYQFVPPLLHVQSTYSQRYSAQPPRASDSFPGLLTEPATSIRPRLPFHRCAERLQTLRPRRRGYTHVLAK